MEEKVVCETPTPGKAPVRIPKWKYDCVAAAILDSVAAAGPNGLPFTDLAAAVAARLSPQARARLGSLGWHVTTVKLDLEVQGRLQRLGGRPQRLVRGT